MITLLHPIPGAKITGTFGEKDPPYPPTGHLGIDYSCWLQEIRAAHAGLVITAKSATYGNYVRLIGYDPDQGLYETRYAHLAQHIMKPGQVIYAGTTIGISGKTGKVTGAHLHFELRIAGKPVDPQEYMPCEHSPQAA